MDDAGFRATVARINSAAAAAGRHGTAHHAANAAQAAAPGPAGEVHATAAARQVGRINEQKPGTFDKDGFAALLRSRIDAKAPRDPQEARDFPKSGKLGELKTELTGAARTSAADAGANLQDQAQAAPDQNGIEPKPVTPLPDPGATGQPGAAGEAAAGNLNAAQAAPKPLPDAAVSGEVTAAQQQLDDSYTQAGVTDRQLARANEPAFSQALANKQAAGRATAAVPGQYRAAEATVLAGSRAQAVAAAGQQVAAMGAVRGAQLAGVTGRQHGTMAADQAARAKVAADLEKIYADTSQAVKDRLAKLETDATAAFDTAATEAKQAFEDYVSDQLDDRYENPLTWAADKLTWGVPAAVQAIYDAGRARFIAAMDAAIDRVSGIVADGLNEAKQLAADGRKRVADAVAAQPLALRGVAADAARDIGAKFDALDQSVTAKRDQLVDVLAAKYTDAVKQLDDRIAQLQEEQKGWLARAYDKVAGVISTIIEMKNLLLKVLAKAVDTLEVIIADPIGFLRNLGSAIGQGVRNFAANILTHLKRGFFEWLFGEIAKAGITLPTSWDLKSIFGLVMEVLGLTWPQVRQIAVEVVGEPIVRTLEVAAEPIVAFVREGPAGAWNWIKEQLGNLKAMVIDQIQSWVITKVIKEGIEWVVSLLSPASAFIEACKKIYTVLEFIWTNGKRILEFVNSVVDSIAEIAAGSIGKAAAKVEESLAKAIPLTIAFLADLLDLGDLADTIKGIIAKIQQPVHAAVKWLITKAVALIKAAGKLLGFGKEDKEETKKSSHPIFESVRAELAKRLSESEDEEHIRAAAKDVLVEYQDKGLHGLEVKTQENQDLGVVAYGSDHETLESYEPKRRAIALTVTITLGEETTKAELSGHQPVTGTDVTWLPSVQDPRVKPTRREIGRRPVQGGVAKLSPQGKQLLVRTWNTGDMRRSHSNATHAERQFAEFFERNRKMIPRVISVELYLHALKDHGSSPCPMCAGALVDALGDLPKEGKVFITWDKGLYINPNENIQERDALGAVGLLKANQFKLFDNPPMEPPVKKPFQRVGR